MPLLPGMVDGIMALRAVFALDRLPRTLDRWPTPRAQSSRPAASFSFGAELQELADAMHEWLSLVFYFASGNTHEVLPGPPRQLATLAAAAACIVAWRFLSHR